MTLDEATNKKYIQAANITNRAGILPFPGSETLIEVLKFYLDDEDLNFINQNFDEKTSLSLGQLMEKSKLKEEEIDRMADKLAKKGFMFNQPSSKGLKVYRLLPLILIGTFEYNFMKKLPEESKLDDHKKIGVLYKKLLEELRDNIQQGYDNLLPFFEKQPAVDRTIPVFLNTENKPVKIIVNESIKTEEQVLPAQTVEEIINKFDIIAVGHCFCRNYHKVLGHDCEMDSPSEVCFSFGKSARHTIAQGFARQVDKDEALQILKSAEEAGLIHKAFHNGSNINKEENSICNCCKDCCDTFELWRSGTTPLVNSTNYLSIINQDECNGCNVCVERCPVDAIKLNDNDRAERKESYCIGCGVCSRFCTSNAISLQEGMRRVYVPPPRLRL